MVSITSSETPDGGKSAAAPRSLNDVVIRLAGNSQDGIQAVGGFLARLAGRSAQEVMTYMTIPSTISGGPSIFQVRMGTGDILSAGDRADVLVAFYQHSYESHRPALRPGGVLLYDSDHVQPNPEDHEITAVGVPFTTATVEAVGGSAKEKGKNIYVLGLLARMFDPACRARTTCAASGDSGGRWGFWGMAVPSGSVRGAGTDGAGRSGPQAGRSVVFC